MCFIIRKSPKDLKIILINRLKNVNQPINSSESWLNPSFWKSAYTYFEFALKKNFVKCSIGNLIHFFFAAADKLLSPIIFASNCNCTNQYSRITNQKMSLQYVMMYSIFTEFFSINYSLLSLIFFRQKIWPDQFDEFRLWARRQRRRPKWPEGWKRPNRRSFRVRVLPTRSCFRRFRWLKAKFQGPKNPEPSGSGWQQFRSRPESRWLPARPFCRCRPQKRCGSFWWCWKWTNIVKIQLLKMNKCWS